MSEIRVRVRPHKSAEPPASVQPTDIFERDDGMFQIGLADDAPGPFESRSFAEAVRLSRTHYLPRAVRQ
jgi:hypothetical protein